MTIACPAPTVKPAPAYRPVGRPFLHDGRRACYGSPAAIQQVTVTAGFAEGRTGYLVGAVCFGSLDAAKRFSLAVWRKANRAAWAKYPPTLAEQSNDFAATDAIGGGR